ncbi:cell wall-associated protease [Enterococcus hirae]|uniref:adhesive domain-containing protein n=1 Tax=Enterococcus hirae TaxID=1354 RepID=UPI0010255FBB|nr:adhesive domain-containing protein [Enterococcus hirae]VFA56119.1 cell wall-associated protease [Enterococcus hirae]VTS68364.1 cell wall-associated protease [Enterococcus hirae]
MEYFFQAGKQTSRNLLLLHGTGGDEHSLLETAQFLEPDATILSFRGSIKEDGMNRFFRRNGLNQFDYQSLAEETALLYHEISAVSQKENISLHDWVIVGYSNGANIAAHLLLSRNTELRKGILFHPMSLNVNYPAKIMTDTQIWLSYSKTDPIVSSVQALPLIGTVLGTLLSPFVTALSQFITSLNSPTSDNSKNLVAASILGNTSVSLPFLLSSPKLTQDLTANFKGGFIQTDQSTIQLGPTTGTTPVYFSAGALTWQTTSLPTHLNFGQHLIQTQQDEHLVATNNNQVTTGSISITDTRTVVKNWQIKVQQLSPWQNGTNQLTSQLQISTADLTTTFPITGITSTANQMVPLSIGTQQTLLKLNGVTDPGQVQLAINQFSLAVPKESLKTKGTYQTMVEWLLSDTP